MIIFGLLFSGIANAQKLHVYRQEVKAGTAKHFVDENGKEYSSATQDFAYLIYLQTSSNPVFKELWIDGNRYEFKVDSVSGPVVVKQGFKFKNGQHTDTLVNKTSDKLYRIFPGRKMNDVAAKNQKGVIVVTKGKKFKVPRAKELPAQYNQ